LWLYESIILSTCVHSAAVTMMTTMTIIMMIENNADIRPK